MLRRTAVCVDLSPQRYTLFVLAVLGALAVCFWHARRLRLYLPAAALCTVLAVGLGVWMQRDVVQINLVGASNNPCVVCVQNGQAVVFFRGGESNWSAVQNYLAGPADRSPRWSLTCAPSRRRWNFPRQRS